MIGHQHILEFLTRVQKRGTVAHAYLFVGPEGVGKSAVAAHFLSELLGVGAHENSDDSWHALRIYSDFTLIEREVDQKTEKKKQMIGVDQIRALRARLSMGSFLSSWKVGVILEAETLSIEAANALLKTLEEPSGQTLIILIASSVAAVPETVRSRCQLLRFQLVPTPEIKEGLSKLGVLDAEEFARRAEGRPGAALRLARDAAFAEGERERAEAFARVLGAPMWRRIAFAEASSKKEAGDDAVGEAKRTLGIWETVLRDALMLSVGEPGLVRSLGLSDLIALWAKGKAPRAIVGSFAALARAREALGENVVPRTALEHVLRSV